jgi:endonuclease/exonuclease/phosphatase family metal-dependent hydrolase
MNEPGAAGEQVAGWQQFSVELACREEEWIQIRDRHPGLPLVVAGDLNQSLDGSNWYGSAPTRKALWAALAAVGLECLTRQDVVAARKLKDRHLVDHICATTDLSLDGDIRCWERDSPLGIRMSDHPCVALSLMSR